ncbi:MAG: MBL fold metallo-hydrolase [Methanoregulaceae archaeon]|nr:MBL fold metallo-hydrolase [Methanoregulaceae archaeon]
MPVTWIPGRGAWANAYLAGDVLVDAGVSPVAVEKYRDTIRTIVLTHGHFDHTANLVAIARMCDAEVCIHELDTRGLTDEGPSLSSHFASRPPGIVPDRTLTGGDRIGDLVVIHTPGHTPGSICLYDEPGKALISGDTVFTDGGFGRFDFPGGDRDALARSISMLSALEVEGLYPGHGMPVTSGGGRHILAASELLKVTYV